MEGTNSENKSAKEEIPVEPLQQCNLGVSYMILVEGPTEVQ